MIRRALLIFMLVLPLVASAERLWHATGEAVLELGTFDAWMRAFMTEHGISGGSLAVTLDGRLVLSRGYTWSEDPDDLVVQPDTRFRIASLSKGITAMGVMQLVQAGHLSLDDKVVELIDAPVPADDRVEQVTVRQLLQHLGGWDRDISGDPLFADAAIARRPGVDRPVSTADIIDFVFARELDHAPGSVYAYSNFGFLLAGHVIEAVSGLTYGEFIQRRVLLPLGVRNMALGRTRYDARQSNEVKYHAPGTGFTVLDDSGAQVPLAYGTFNLENIGAAGGWIASATDLVRYAASLDDPRESPVLGPAAVDTLFALPEHIPAASYRRGDSYYALGWAVRDFGASKSTFHSGGIPGTMTMLVRRQDGISYAVLFNRVDWGLYGQIDADLFGVASSIGRWPEHDLFAARQHPPNGGAIRPGLLYDRTRVGHGLEIRPAGDTFSMLFYSYDALGAPEWYIATGDVHEQLFVARDIHRVTYDAARSPPQQVDPAVNGHFVIDFRHGAVEPACAGSERGDPDQLALFDWSIGAERGQWCVEPLRFGEPPAEPDLSGTWWAGPEDEGWGLSIAVQGAEIFLVLYYYDGRGEPRFAIGQASLDQGFPVTVPMQQVDGYCRGCEADLAVRDVGSIELDLATPDQAGGAGNTASVDVTFLGEAGGNWHREGADLRLLSNPAGTP